MAEGKGGVPGWLPPGDSQRRPGGPQQREAPYFRAIGWALVVWVATVGVVYVVAQVLGAQQLGGWVGFAGFLISFWIGGRQAGISGRQEWLSFIVALSGIAVVMVGFAACVASMAMYG